MSKNRKSRRHLPLLGSWFGPRESKSSLKARTPLRLESLEERRLLAVSPLGNEFRVNATTVGIQRIFTENPQSVAMDDEGDFVVTWSSFGQDGSGYGVFARRYTSAGSPLSEFQVNTFTQGNQQNSAVAMDDVGNFVITWSSEQQDGQGFGIFGQRFSRTGARLGGEFQVNTTTANNQRNSAVAMAKNGAFVVTWTSDEQDGSFSGIYAQRYNAAGTKLGGEFKVNTFTLGVQDFSRVAMDADGDFVVVWSSDLDPSNDYSIYAQRYNAAGVMQGGEFRVNTPTPGNQINASVAMNDGGDFIVTWTGPEILAQVFSRTGARLGGEFQVNQVSINQQDLSRVAFGPNNTFVVTWQSLDQDGSNLGIIARQFDANGVPLTNDFIVNTTTINAQSRPSIGMNILTGDFVIVWQGEIQDPDNSPGVYARRYQIPNAAPTTSGISNVTFAEDAPPVTVDLYAAFADAEDTDEQLLIVVQSNTNPTLFSTLSISNGILTIDSAPDKFGTATITIRATDTGGLFVDASFTVTVTAVNDPPFFNPIANVTVQEDSGLRTVTITGISAGPNENQGLFFTVNSNNPSIVPTPTINYNSPNTTGTLSFTPAPNAFGSVLITVTLTDNSPDFLSFTRTFTINVTPVNDPPTFDPIANVTVAEDSGTTAVPLTGISPGIGETTGTVTFSALSSNPTIIPNPTFNYTNPNTTGTLNFTPGPNRNGTVTITVTATDNGGASSSRTFTITVTPVNDGPPTTNDVTANTPEDTDVTITLPGSSGVDTNETLTAVIVSLPTNGRLFQSFGSGVRGAQITAPNTVVTGAGRQVIFAPDSNEFGAPYATFQFKINDGELDSTNATVTVNVAAVNDPPTLDPLGNLTIPEDSAMQVVNLSGITAGPGETQTLTVTAFSSNPAVIPNPTVTYTSPNATGSISFTPVANANGPVTITVRVTDNGGGTNVFERTFTVNITPINDGPPTAFNGVFGADEDTQFAIQLPASAGVDTNETLTATIVSLPTNGSIFQTTDGVNFGARITAPGTVVTDLQRRVIFIPDLNENGIPYATFTFRVNDGDFDSNVATITVNITAVNDAPISGDDTYALGSTPGGNVATGSIKTNDSDAENDPTTVEVILPPANGNLSMNPDGTFTYTAGAGFTGVDSFTYRLNDGTTVGNTATVLLLGREAVLVDKVYRQVLLRPADEAGLRFWTAQIRSGFATIGTVASGIFESPERLDPIIAQYYLDYLFRPVDAEGLTFWRGIWQADGGPDRVIAGIISSEEFFTAPPVNSVNENFVSEVYIRLLGRPADFDGLVFWSEQLNSGAIDRYQMVLGFVQSDENYRNLIAGWYIQYLGRPVSQSESDFFLAQMKSGVSQRTVQITIIDSPEYSTLPVPPAPGTAVRL